MSERWKASFILSVEVNETRSIMKGLVRAAQRKRNEV